MKEFIRIGVDLAKNYFQIHALDSEDGHAATRKFCRQAMRKFVSEIEPCVVRMEPWVVGMEACGRAHYWRANRGRWVTRGSRGAFDPADLRQAQCQAR